MNKVFKKLETFCVDESNKTGFTIEHIAESLISEYQWATTNTARGRIAMAVQEIMRSNLAATEWYDRVGISSTQIFKNSGCNQHSISQWRKDNSKMLDLHHKAMGIDGIRAYNRAAGAYRRQTGA